MRLRAYCGKRAGGWALLATTPVLAEAVLNLPKTRPLNLPWFLPESITPNGSRLSLVLQGTVGLVGRATLGYRLEGGRLECTARLTSTLDAHRASGSASPTGAWETALSVSAKTKALFPWAGVPAGRGTVVRYARRRATLSPAARPAPPDRLVTAAMAVRWRNWLVSMTMEPRSGLGRACARGAQPDVCLCQNHFEWRLLSPLRS